MRCKVSAMSGQPKSGLRQRRLARFRGLAALVVSIGLLASACAAGDGDGGESDSSSENSELALEEILTGEFETIDGPVIDLETVQNKDVVFWFWAPW